MVHESCGITPFYTNFTKRRHIVHADVRAYCSQFIGDIVKEILALPTVFIRRVLTRLAKPIRPLPPGKLPHDRTLVKKLRMERRTANTPRCDFLTVGIVIRIKQAERFLGALYQIRLVGLKWLHTRDINVA